MVLTAARATPVSFEPKAGGGTAVRRIRAKRATVRSVIRSCVVEIQRHMIRVAGKGTKCIVVGAKWLVMHILLAGMFGDIAL